MRILTITRPDDWHVHVRDNEVLSHTVNASAHHFARALIMPNLIQPLNTLAGLNNYRQRILQALSPRSHFIPYMTLYLNEQLKPDDLEQAAQDSYILGAKLYPAGATTNSAQGVKSINALYPLFEIMQANHLVLQLHGEVTHGDIFGRETRFIESHLIPLMQNFPKLRIVLEHITTRKAVDFVTEASSNIAATITPHHLLYNRNHLLVGGIKPHFYCLPILKQARDQRALQQAAISGNPKFFAGTDSAPHAKHDKEKACGCAGIYSAPYAVALYAQLFEQLQKLEQLDFFMGRWGAEFYHLPKTKDQIELIKTPQIIPHTLPFGDNVVVPIAAGSTIEWSIHEAT